MCSCTLLLLLEQPRCNFSTMMYTRGLQDIRVERSLTLKLYYGCHTYTPLKSLRKTYVFLVQFPTHQHRVLGKFTKVCAYFSTKNNKFSNQVYWDAEYKIFCIYVNILNGSTYYWMKKWVCWAISTVRPVVWVVLVLYSDGLGTRNWNFM